MPPPPAKKFASSQASSAAAAGTTDSPAPIPLGRVVPKVPAAPRPPIFLKVDHLTDPKKGIASLPKVLIPEGEGQAPFKGKGHELEDLRLLLSRAKLWAHRLFPRITFEDFVERAEMLGSKRPVRNFLTRIRHGMPLTFGTTNEDGQLVDGLSDDEEEAVVGGEGGEKNGAGGDQTTEDSSSAAAAVVEDSESTAAAESTSEFKFDRLFREFSHSTAAASSSEPLTTMIEEVKEDESGETASNKAEDSLAVESPPAESQQQQQQSSSQQQKQPSVEEFDMDDDDFDEDFLSSFKP